MVEISKLVILHAQLGDQLHEAMQPPYGVGSVLKLKSAADTLNRLSSVLVQEVVELRERLESIERSIYGKD